MPLERAAHLSKQETLITIILLHLKVKSSYQSFVDDTGKVIENARTKSPTNNLTPEQFAEALQDSGKYGINTDKGQNYGKPVGTFVHYLTLTINAMPGHIQDATDGYKMRRFNTIGIYILVASAPTIAWAADPSNIPVKIDSHLAQRLVMDANNSDPINAKNYLLTEPWDAPFIYYEWLGMNEDALGWFDVNPWTGDVWDVVLCKHLTTPALRKKQDEIRQRFTADELTQYDRLSALKPNCWN